MSDEHLESKTRYWRYGQWWPMLLGPTGMFAVYVGQYFHQEYIFSRGSNESVALILLGIALINFLLQTCLFRSNFYLFMVCLSGAFFCREWHFSGTSTGIYVALVFLGFWAVKQKTRFEKVVGNGRFRIWLIATMVTYLLSQLIARRVFRYICLPQEAQLHIYLEETVETLAHIMLILVSFAAWKIGFVAKQSSKE